LTHFASPGVPLDAPAFENVHLKCTPGHPIFSFLNTSLLITFVLSLCLFSFLIIVDLFAQPGGIAITRICWFVGSMVRSLKLVVISRQLRVRFTFEKSRSYCKVNTAVLKIFQFNSFKISSPNMSVVNLSHFGMKYDLTKFKMFAWRRFALSDCFLVLFFTAE